MRIAPLLATALVSLSLLSCSGDNVDADGVPKVDVHGIIIKTTDPKKLEFSKSWGLSVPATRMLTVNGKQMPLAEFLQTYCQAKFANETCVRATKIDRIDSIRGPRENLPAGL